MPAIDTVGDLAERLELDPGQLDWLADVRGLERTVRDRRLRNYTYLRVPRRAGPDRVLERPKLRLKEIQRRILNEILIWIPVHDAAHGFVRGRSARSHAALHTGRRVVVRFDLEDFFASVTAGRVYAIFRAAGYPEAVAHTLTGLCTNVAPRELEVPSPAGAPARHAAPAAGRADLARAREPRRVPARLPAQRARRRRRRPLQPLRRRSGALQRHVPARHR